MDRLERWRKDRFIAAFARKIANTLEYCTLEPADLVAVLESIKQEGLSLELQQNHKAYL